MYNLLFILMYYAKYRLEEIIILTIVIYQIFIFKGKISINKNKIIKLLFLFSLLFLISIMKIKINNYSYLRFFEQYVILGTTFFSYFFIFEIKNFRFLWEKYLKISLIFALIGLIQFIIYFLFEIDFTQIDQGSHFSVVIKNKILRINPFSHEPGSFGQILLPATIFYILNYKNNKLKAFVILLVNLLTFSVNTYLILTLFFVSKIFKKKYMIQIMSLMPFISLILWKSKDAWFFKIKDVLNGLRSLISGNYLYMDKVNLSSFSILSSIYVVQKSQNYFLGTGIGTHPNNYFKYLPKELIFYNYGNYNDAYSLLIRMFSEVGVIGIIFLIYFLIKNYERDNFINNSCSWGIIGFFFKGGSYTRFGIVFFIFMIIYSKGMENEIDKI